MTITPLKLIVAGVALVMVLFVVAARIVGGTTGGSSKPVVVDSTVTLVMIGKLHGHHLFRIDDHDRQVSCYAIALGGMDCDRSFYERR